MSKRIINQPQDIMSKTEIKNLYEGVFNSVKHAIGINLYTDLATLDNVIITEGDKQIFKICCEDYTALEMFRQIKKQLIKNCLYVESMEAKEENLIIYTTKDLLKLLYVPIYDEENFNSKELEEIMEEIK